MSAETTDAPDPRPLRWWITIGLAALAAMLAHIATSLFLLSVERETADHGRTWAQPVRTLQTPTRTAGVRKLLGRLDQASVRLLAAAEAGPPASVTDSGSATGAESVAGGRAARGAPPTLAAALPTVGIATNWVPWVTQHFGKYETGVAAVLLGDPASPVSLAAVKQAQSDPETWATFWREALTRAAAATGTIAGHRYQLLTDLEMGLPETQALAAVQLRRQTVKQVALDDLLQAVEDAFREE